MSDRVSLEVDDLKPLVYRNCSDGSPPLGSCMQLLIFQHLRRLELTALLGSLLPQVLKDTCRGMSRKHMGLTRDSLQDGTASLGYPGQLPRNTAWHTMEPHQLPSPLNKMPTTAGVVVLVDTIIDQLHGLMVHMPGPVHVPQLLHRPLKGFCGPGPDFRSECSCCMLYDSAMIASPFLMMPRGKARLQSGSYLGKRLKIGKRRDVLLAHRVVCMAFWGVPESKNCVEGMCEVPHAIHICGNRSCLNPYHLWWASAQFNAYHHQHNKADLVGNEMLAEGSRAIGWEMEE